MQSTVTIWFYNTTLMLLMSFLVHNIQTQYRCSWKAYVKDWVSAKKNTLYKNHYYDQIWNVIIQFEYSFYNHTSWNFHPPSFYYSSRSNLHVFNYIPMCLLSARCDIWWFPVHVFFFFFLQGHTTRKPVYCSNTEVSGPVSGPSYSLVNKISITASKLYKLSQTTVTDAIFM